MLERFKYYSPSQIIKDNKTGQRYYGNKPLVELLNRLHEDNQMLDRLVDKRDGWNNLAHDRIFELEKENEQLKKDVEYWKQVASQYNNELNVFEHCKKYKTECKDIHWSSD